MYSGTHMHVHVIPQGKYLEYWCPHQYIVEFPVHSSALLHHGALSICPVGKLEGKNYRDTAYHENFSKLAFKISLTYMYN